jgi:uncharacterized caspase-like protein
MSRQDDIKTLISKHQRRLQKLLEQKAEFGLNTPAEILIEIEDIQAEIEQLESQLQAAELEEAQAENEALVQTQPISTVESRTNLEGSSGSSMVTTVSSGVDEKTQMTIKRSDSVKDEPNVLPQFDVFLSHSSVDKPWVITLKDHLRRYGVSVWLDQDEIPPGAFIGKALEQALLDNCRTVALIVSPEAINSGWVEEEYNLALSLAKSKPTPVQIIPVILREAELPGFLQSRNWVDFRDETSYAQNVWKLVWGITGKKPAQVLDMSAADLPSVDPIHPERQTEVMTTNATIPGDLPEKSQRLDLGFGQRRLALLIGNSNFDDVQTFRHLHTPANDVKDFAQSLQTYGDFEMVETLINAPADQITRAIDDLFSQAETDDLVLLYYSGHGYRGRDGRHYLIAKDTQPKRLLSSGIRDTFIHEAIKNSRAKHRVIILDCCFSGAFVAGRKGGAGEPLLLEELTEEGTAILASSSTIQHSFEENCHHSLFTHYLLRGINTGQADEDHDGLISVDELFKYADQKVRYKRPDQTPFKEVLNGDGQIIIAKNPRDQVVKLPADVVTALQSSSQDLRLAGIKQLKRLAQGDDEALATLARDTLDEITFDQAEPVVTDEAELPQPVPKPATDSKPGFYHSSIVSSAIVLIVLAVILLGGAFIYKFAITPQVVIQEMYLDFTSPEDLPGPGIPIQVPARIRTKGTTKFVHGYDRHLWFIVCDHTALSCNASKLEVYSSESWNQFVSIGQPGPEDSCKQFEVAFAVVDGEAHRDLTSRQGSAIPQSSLPPFQNAQWLLIMRQPDHTTPDRC